MNDAPRWRGTRGEWYVVVQVGLFLLVGLGPRELPGVSSWGPPWSLVTLIVGLVLGGLGGLLGLAGLLYLGANLTPLPHPKDDATLVETGAYALVRHPIYSGLSLAAFGWALVVASPLTLLYALMLFIFFDLKSRREERQLLRKFERYAEYQKRVRKLIPFIY
ncbi:MAG: isoprenylcysteine carboxylmethyltransferase family protein [Anaerolineales bacterium]|nr:isoprenylcysteine carboxylmethyltransferase family protein [Anaerolineales bacterium]